MTAGPIAPDACTLHIGLLPYTTIHDWLLLGVIVGIVAAITLWFSAVSASRVLDGIRWLVRWCRS